MDTKHARQKLPAHRPRQPARRGPRLGLPWLGLLGVLAACSALHLEERFIAHGDLIELLPDGPQQVDSPVRVFLQTAPEGFDFVAGRPVVQPGYRHRLLGRIDLWVDRGVCDGAEAGHLSRETVIKRLRARAHQEGGDAVVYAQTRAADGYRSDCERVADMGDSLFDRPWAEGWVALLEREPEGPSEGDEAEPTGLSTPASLMFDGGVPTSMDAGQPDATLPNRPPSPAVPPPPPDPGPKPIPKHPPMPPTPAPAPSEPHDQSPANMVPAPPPA